MKFTRTVQYSYLTADSTINLTESNSRIQNPSSFDAGQAKDMGTFEFRQHQQTHSLSAASDISGSKSKPKSVELQKMVAAHGMWSSVKLPGTDHPHSLEPLKEQSTDDVNAAKKDIDHGSVKK